MSDSLFLFATRLAEHSPRALPLGAARVAAVLGPDATIKLASLEESAVDFAERLVAVKPQIIGFSVYVWNRDFLCTSSRAIDTINKSILRIAGGPEAGANPLALLEEGKFHLVLAGEGESVIKEIVQEFALHGLDFTKWKELPGLHVVGRPAPKQGRSPAAKLDALPSPYLTGLLNPQDYGGALWELSRGCPFSCTYCYESRGEKSTRSLDLATVEKELIFLDQHGADRIFVLDPTFNMQKKRSLAILELIAKHAPGIHFDFEVRAELLDMDLAQAFSTIQTALQIGLQSAHRDVLKVVGRDINRSIFKSKLALLDQAGVVFGLDLMIGLPRDSLRGFLESLDYAITCRPNHLDIFRLAVLPGTTLALDANTEGLIWDEKSPYLIRSSPQFPAEDLDLAEEIASLCQIFYNKGRAVTWFEQVLKVLKWKPSEFFTWLAGQIKQPKPQLLLPDHCPDGSKELSDWQAQILSLACEVSEQGFAIAACTSLVQYFGALSRALAEGIETTVELSYPPTDLENLALENLAHWASRAKKSKGKYRIRPDAKHGVLVRFMGP